MHRRLSERDFSRRFVCMTFDDGYRDIVEHAYPLLKDEGVPFAVYVPTSFPDRIGELVVARARSGDLRERTHPSHHRRP